MMIAFSYPLLVLIDTLQLLFMHTFLLISPLPYLWYNINNILGFFHFTFLPKLYTQEIAGSKTLYSEFQSDTTMLGNIHPFVFIVSIFLFVYFIFWILSTKTVNRSDCFRKRVKKIFRGRMKLSFLFEAFYYPAFYTLFWAMYQLKGYHSNLPEAGANLAMSIIFLITYLVFFILLLYITAKTRNKINSVPEKMKKHEDLPKMPKKFSFLVIEPSQFSLEIALRFFMKIAFAIALLIENMQVQLILFLVFNLIFLLYFLIFKPSLYKVTNRLNIFICLFFIAIEIVLFLFTITLKTSSDQETISIVCLALEGLMILIIIIWMIYRFVILIAK